MKSEHYKSISQKTIDEWKREKLIKPAPKDGKNAKKDSDYLARITWRKNGKRPFVETRWTKKRATKLIDTYYKEIDKAKTDKQLLTAIAKLCRALEISHIFCDGNQRTIAFVILQKLLLENGFSPAILNDPTCFDGYMSLQQLVSEIKKGIDNFGILHRDCLRQNQLVVQA